MYFYITYVSKWKNIREKLKLLHKTAERLFKIKVLLWGLLCRDYFVSIKSITTN